MRMNPETLRIKNTTTTVVPANEMSTNKMFISDTNSSTVITGAQIASATTTNKTTCTTVHNLPQSSTNRRNRAPCKVLHDVLLDIVDLLFSCILVAPCVIAYWRGTWELMGVYIFPHNLALSALMSFLIGGLGHMLFTLMQFFIVKHIHPDKGRMTYYIISRLYTAVFGFVCVNMWRGSWILCDILTSANSLAIICIITTLSLIFMIFTRTVRNLASPPFTICVDHKYNYFDVNTMFNVEGFRQPGLYILDTLFSVFVIGSLIVLVWRGTWGIIDLTFFPHNREKSAWGSLFVGYAIVLLCFVIQPIMRCICNQIKDPFKKLIICDIYHILTFLGAVNCWRGLWNLLDICLFANNKVLGYWVTMIVPFLILLAIKCSNSVLVRGVYLDANGAQGDSLDTQISFCKLHFERERNKKAALHTPYIHFHLTRNLEQQTESLLLEKPTKMVEATTKKTAIADV